jgi:hypothetical protein
MRFFVTRTDGPTEPQAVFREILTRPGVATATPDLVKAFNPHLDFTRPLPAGSVLLIPNTADVKAGAGTTIGAEELRQVLDDVDAGMTRVSERTRAGFEQLEGDRAAVAAALKPAAAKRLVESDPELKKQLDAAEASFKEEKKQASATEAQLAEVHKLAVEEFGRLRKLLGG